jgi:hypothetical protein
VSERAASEANGKIMAEPCAAQSLLKCESTLARTYQELGGKPPDTETSKMAARAVVNKARYLSQEPVM